MTDYSELANYKGPAVEKDIVFENDIAWVYRDKDKYTVFRSGVTHSTSDSAYPLDDDGLSLAVARAKYLEQRGLRR
jgi:hypothetical protein